MTIPEEILSLIDRIDRELDQTEQSATQGLTFVRQILENFPNNVLLIQFFAYLSSVLLFVETSQRQIQNTIERLSLSNVTDSEIKEVGEDLGTLLGRVVETKIKVEGIIHRLERLR